MGPVIQIGRKVVVFVNDRFLVCAKEPAVSTCRVGVRLHGNKVCGGYCHELFGGDESRGMELRPFAPTSVERQG